MTRPRRLEVVWEDSRLLGGSWGPVRDFLRQRKTTRCRSVGYALTDDRRGIVLAAIEAIDKAG